MFQYEQTMDSVKQAVGLGGPRLAWIGLGNMGRGMVKNIVEKGQYTGAVSIYNRTAARAEKLAATLPAGRTKVVTSISDAVNDADIVFTCVSNDAAIEETIASALKADVWGKLFVDCSTVHPDTTNELGKTVVAAGARFVACPVFGAPAMAENGQLICVLAGPKADVAQVRPLCKGVMGRAEIDYSDQSPGNATRLKIIGNTFILQMIEALSEGHVLAEKSGLGAENLHAFIEVMFPGPYVAYSNRMQSGDYFNREEPAFQAELARKDARHAKNLAQNSGVQLKAVEVVDQHLKAVVDHAGAKGDIAGIYGAVRQEAGLKFENQ